MRISEIVARGNSIIDGVDLDVLREKIIR